MHIGSRPGGAETTVKGEAARFDNCAHAWWGCCAVKPERSNKTKIFLVAKMFVRKCENVRKAEEQPGYMGYHSSYHRDYIDSGNSNYIVTRAGFLGAAAPSQKRRAPPKRSSPAMSHATTCPRPLSPTQAVAVPVRQVTPMAGQTLGC